jgi:hypothetical protein
MATPGTGFTSTLSFACTGLPANATCSFSPATVTPGGSAALTSTLTISTNVATAALKKDAPTHPSDKRAPLLCIIFLGAFTSLRVRRAGGALTAAKSVRYITIFPVLLLCLAFGVLAGCGGGGQSSSKTPAGTSTVTVTASGGGQMETATLTLTVQ